jgi:hypothetical protein
MIQEHGASKFDSLILNTQVPTFSEMDHIHVSRSVDLEVIGLMSTTTTTRKTKKIRKTGTTKTKTYPIIT